MKKIELKKIFLVAKFAIAGAMAGLALVNTVATSVSSTPENVAMGAGAIIATIIVKALHVI
jgi:hypothetical protein